MQKKSFRLLCTEAGINYNTGKSYRRRHPELSNNEVIMHYRPDLVENILGNLIPNPFYKGW